jgi:GTP-binding protein
VYEVSAATGEGLKELTYALAEVVRADRAAHPPAEPTRIVLRPKAVDDAGFTVEAGEDGVYVVRGQRVERWVRQTNFDNDEAVGYLADRLARIGVEEALAKAGAEPGAPVRIGTHEFDYEPTLPADVDFTPSGRGTDWRLEEQSNRPSAAARLAARKARRQRPADEDEWLAQQAAEQGEHIDLGESEDD